MDRRVPSSLASPPGWKGPRRSICRFSEPFGDESYELTPFLTPPVASALSMDGRSDLASF